MDGWEGLDLEEVSEDGRVDWMLRCWGGDLGQMSWRRKGRG